MRRTAIRLDDQLLAEAKQLAAANHRSLTAVIEEALRLLLSLQRSGPGKRPVRLRTFKGKGLAPGVDLDYTAALLDLMDRSHDSD